MPIVAKKIDPTWVGSGLRGFVVSSFLSLAITCKMKFRAILSPKMPGILVYTSTSRSSFVYWILHGFAETGPRGAEAKIPGPLDLFRKFSPKNKHSRGIFSLHNWIHFVSRRFVYFSENICKEILKFIQ